MYTHTAPVAASRVVANPPFELQASIAKTHLRGLNSSRVLYKNKAGGTQYLCYVATID